MVYPIVPWTRRKLNRERERERAKGAANVFTNAKPDRKRERNEEETWGVLAEIEYIRNT